MKDVISKKDRVVVKSNLHIYAMGLRLSSGFKKKIEKKVELMIKDSVDRAVGNNRKTLMEYDL